MKEVIERVANIPKHSIHQWLRDASHLAGGREAWNGNDDQIVANKASYLRSKRE